MLIPAYNHAQAATMVCGGEYEGGEDCYTWQDGVWSLSTPHTLARQRNNPALAWTSSQGLSVCSASDCDRLEPHSVRLRHISLYPRQE